jgi:hypothetical protein
VAWHAATSKHTDLVLIPLPIALWARDHDGHPVTLGELVPLQINRALTGTGLDEAASQCQWRCASLAADSSAGS